MSNIYPFNQCTAIIDVILMIAEGKGLQLFMHEYVASEQPEKSKTIIRGASPKRFDPKKYSIASSNGLCTLASSYYEEIAAKWVVPTL